MSETHTQSAVTTSEPAPAARPRGPTVKQLAVVVVILAAGIVVTALTSDVKKVSEPGVRLVNDEPVLEETIGRWTGGPQEGLSEQERTILPQDTRGARRVYKDDAGRQLSCSIILAGRDVTSIHRPELCLPGQGWNIDSEFVTPLTVTTAPGGQLPVMRMNTTRPVRLQDGSTVPYRSVFAYWFIGKDRTTPHHWERILWTTRDRVLHNTNHRWAYILIHSPVVLTSPQDDVREAETRAVKLIEEFVQDLHPTLMMK